MAGPETAPHTERMRGAELAQCAVRFGIFDATQDVRGLVEVTTREGEDSKIIVSWWRAERMLFHAALATSGAHDEDGGVTTDLLSITPAASGSEWDLAFASVDAQVNLRWNTAVPSLSWSLPTAPAFAHEERFGTVTGTLTVRGETVTLDAVGHREVERGPALFAVADHAFSCRTFVAPDRYAYTAIVTVARRDHLFGCIVADGDASELSTAEIAVAHAHAGGPPLLGTVDVDDRSGRTLRQSFARGAVFSTVDAVEDRFLTRHVAFPGMSWDTQAGTGQIDCWYTDETLLRPHLFVSAGAEVDR